MKKISTGVGNNQPPARFCDMKRDLSKETYKKLRIGQYTSLSPIACPILFLKTLLYFVICLFLQKLFYMFGKNIKLKVLWKKVPH
jgi:hypothetical protein